MNTRKGIIFNIQHFSLHDGPYTYDSFLERSPLRCPWCANPESQNENLNPCLMLLVKNDHHGRRKIC